MFCFPRFLYFQTVFCSIFIAVVSQIKCITQSAGICSPFLLFIFLRGFLFLWFPSYTFINRVLELDYICETRSSYMNLFVASSHMLLSRSTIAFPLDHKTENNAFLALYFLCIRKRHLIWPLINNAIICS